MEALRPVVRKMIDAKIRDALAKQFARKPAPGLSKAPAPPAPVAKAAPASAAKAAPAKRPATKVAKKVAKSAANGELTIEAVRGALTGRPDGLRSEALRKVMGLSDKQRRPLAAKLSEWTKAGFLSRKGEKRTTTYTLKAKK